MTGDGNHCLCRLLESIFTQNQFSLLFDIIDFMHIGYVLVSDDTLDRRLFFFKDLKDWIIRYTFLTH